MAQPSLKAEFFVRPDGVCFAKARALKESERGKFFRASVKTCALCGVDIARLGIQVNPFMTCTHGQIDHVFPRSRGGQNESENLRLLCVSCNCSKGAK